MFLYINPLHAAIKERNNGSAFELKACLRQAGKNKHVVARVTGAQQLRSLPGR